MTFLSILNKNWRRDSIIFAQFALAAALYGKLNIQYNQAASCTTQAPCNGRV